MLSLFVRYFFTVNGGFVAIYLLVDFFEKIDDFTNAGKPFALAAQYFVLTIPFIVDQLGPVFILLSGVITLGILNHTNELTALKAGGVPLRLILRPILLGSLFCTLLFVGAAEYLLPVTIAKTNNIWYEQLKGKVPLGILRNNRYYYKGKEGFYSFAWPDPRQTVFRNFSYSTWDDKHNLKSLTTAYSAQYNVEQNSWLLADGQTQESVDNVDDFKITNFKLITQTYPESPGDFLVPANKAAELSLTGLYNEIGRYKGIAYETLKAKTAFFGRVSYILLGIPLLLLGLPILLISYQRWGRDLSIAIPASCGLAFLAWGLWGALQSLAVTGYIPPLVAASSIHVIFSVIGFALLVKFDR